MNTLVKHWWAILLRGILAILFGLFTFFWPGGSLAALVLVFGAFAFVDGILALVSALGRGIQHRGFLIFEGLMGIAAGVVTFFYPALTAVALYALVAGWALITGVLELVVAVRWRRVIRGEGLLITVGVTSILLGVLMIALPLVGILTVAWIVASYALLSGVALVALALRLRHWARHGERLRPT